MREERGSRDTPTRAYPYLCCQRSHHGTIGSRDNCVSCLLGRTDQTYSAHGSVSYSMAPQRSPGESVTVWLRPHPGWQHYWQISDCQQCALEVPFHYQIYNFVEFGADVLFSCHHRTYTTFRRPVDTRQWASCVDSPHRFHFGVIGLIGVCPPEKARNVCHTLRDQ